MPKKLEQKLKKEAKKKGMKGKRADAYVYGTMNKLGMMKGNKMTAKGMMMEQKDMMKGRQVFITKGKNVKKNKNKKGR